MARIIYTHTDEAPLLATYSFLPIVAGVRRQGRRRRRDPRHLAGGADPRPVPRPAHRRAAPRRRARRARRRWPRRPRPTSSSCPTSRASIPQLKAAIKELQEQGFDLPDYPETPTDRRGAGRPRPVRQGQGLGGQPGAARGQLRPPRAGVGEELRHARTRTRWARGRADSKTNVATMGEPTTSARNEKSVIIAADDTLRSSSSPPTGRPPCSRTRSRCSPARSSTRTLHGRRGARRVPRRADRAGQGRRRAVLGAPQGHDDEGLRPDHLRPRREGLLRRRLRSSTAPTSPPPGSRPNDGLGGILAGLDALPNGARSRPRSSRRSPTGRGSRRRLRQGHHQPARPVRRHHRRLDAGDDPHVGRHVQVGDAPVGVDHRERGTVRDALLDRGLDLRALGERRDAGQDAAEPVVRARVRRRPTSRRARRTRRGGRRARRGRR